MTSEPAVNHISYLLLNIKMMGCLRLSVNRGAKTVKSKGQIWLESNSD